jgi:hypothetical protein
VISKDLGQDQKLMVVLELWWAVHGDPAPIWIGVRVQPKKLPMAGLNRQRIKD